MHRDSLDLACWQIIMLFVTSPSKLLRFVSTDFVALRLFSFNIRQHDRQILYFKLHVDGRKFHYQRPQVVHRWCSGINFHLFIFTYYSAFAIP